MNESTRKKMMFGILAAAILFGIYNFMQPRRHSISPSDSGNQTEVSVPASGQLQAKTIDVAKKESESWGRDPFTSGSTPSNTATAHVAPKKAAVAAAPMPVWVLRGGPDRMVDQIVVLHASSVEQARDSGIKLQAIVSRLGEAATVEGPHLYSLMHALAAAD